MESTRDQVRDVARMMWNLDDGKTMRRGNLPPVVHDLALSPDGRWLGVAHRRGAVRLIRLKD